MNHDTLTKAILSQDAKLRSLAWDYLNNEFAQTTTKSFRQFARLFWPVVSTNPLREGWYFDAITDHLASLPTLKRLIINIPPRHGKSSLVAILFPAWFWITHPQAKFIASTYSLKDLSLRDSVACRNVLESPNYQRWYPHVKLSSDQNTKNRFTNTEGGFRFATSIDSGVIGEGADVLLIDDANNVSDVMSEAARKQVIAWWTQTSSTRMNPGGLDAKVIVQQRCHEDDLTGYILRQDDAADWTQLILPWHFDAARRASTALQWHDPRTTPNEPLSSLYTPAKIKELKGGNGLGPTGFATQFDQRPAPAEGNLFKESWFSRYTDAPDAYYLGNIKIPKHLCHLIMVTDLAISLKETADWTVSQVWAITPHGHLLLVEEWRDRVEAPDTVKGFKRMYEKWRPETIHVEDVAFQRMMIQMLKQQGLPVKPLRPQGQDKKARAQRMLVKAECGMVWLPKGLESEWMQEVIQFPNGRHDDRVDCCSWAAIVANSYPIRELPSQEPFDAQAVLAAVEARMQNG